MFAGYLAGKKKGYVQVAAGLVDGTATSFPVPPVGATFAVIQPEAQAVRWRDDGTAPTASVGQPLAVGSELRYDADGLSTLRFCQQTAGAILNVTFYG
jgi:hypothetical protein